MPNQRPRAAFEPLPPDLDVPTLVKSTPNFENVARIHCDAIDANGLESFEKLVRLHVVLGGMPLVVGGFNKRLDSSIFSEKWLRGEHGAKSETARNLTTKSNLPLTIGHYLKNLPLLTNQWNSYNYKEPNRQRIYLKDIDCPEQWHDRLKPIIPPFLFYLNKSDVPETSSNPRVGDLMSCLPPSMRAENLMCYIGHEGTYTPAHQEMCASLGQNIMVEASDGSIEYGKVTKPGSSIWFMTESKDRHVVSEYWTSTLGHDIDVEDHFAQLNAWKAAPFKTYVVEQRPGDFILVPPLAAHQVWNRGTRTMKIAWNRTTPDTLKLALDEALPHARMVCRDEQYKNKAIVFYSLGYCSSLLAQGPANAAHAHATRQLQEDFAKLFALYTGILLSESFQNDMPDEKEIEYIPFDGSITCSYCRSNIFNRFLTCPWCVGDENDTYDICMECYIMGRSCRCRSRLTWVEQFSWKELTEKHEMWRQQIQTFVAGNLFQDFPQARAQMAKKTPAQICQEQLKRRPWVDISKPVYQQVDLSSDSETSSPARKRRKNNANEKRGRCHICRYTEPMWKLASCSRCHVNYCYGSLFRAFNIQPQNTMETDEWVCPKCEKRCSCAACRRDPTMNPFEPTCTLLGHDTRAFADPRSVESLVDFRQSNIRWLKKAGDDEIGRLTKHQMEAEKTDHHLNNSTQLEENLQVAAPSISEIHLEGHGPIRHSTDYGEIPVDPALEHFDGSFLTLESVDQ
ncbi:putative JmjC domain protein [Aspergillus steynii IBT 23096]|uniref:Putative JmjC domain protein n=1 Tax=Aspergillus steynii IBT 23096 TaxID=1392250 RepID=A0A2I2GN87_9EURO|nr:putative JmjC domain protein [Aspergillus steynii IBT 23096]PLB54319.1 putative JmjC domain protein [Aspergillus steynii IBT 23096]